jgi:hypothetical protein
MSCSSVAASWEISSVIATLKQQLVQFDRHACLRLLSRWSYSLRDILPLSKLLKMVTFAQGMQDVSMIPGHHPADAAMTGYLWKGVPIERSSSTGREASALTATPTRQILLRTTPRTAPETTALLDDFWRRLAFTPTFEQESPSN